jgi:hypothetical protein
MEKVRAAWLEFRPAFTLKNASYLRTALGREKLPHKTAGFRRVVLSGEALGADVLWLQNEP